MGNIKIYAPEKSQRFVMRCARMFNFRDDMKIVSVPNGVISIGGQGAAYGVWDEHGKYVYESASLHGKRLKKRPDLHLTDEIPNCDCDAVYLGNCVGHTDAHFGHFLLENMSRAYAALRPELSNAKFVFVKRADQNAPEFMWTLLRGLGIKKSNILVLDTPMRFRRVFVPEQGLNIPKYTSKQVGDIYQTISEHFAGVAATRPTEFYDKIYVSRGKLAARRTFGEGQIERIFAKNGFHIIYPEKLPLATQIAYMAHCRTLAGCAGTALHLALFMPAGGTVIQIKRNSRIVDEVLNQHMVNKTRDMNLVYIWGSVEENGTNHFTECPQIIGVTKYMREFFDDNGFKYTARDTEINAAEYAEYQNALAEYNRVRGGNTSVRWKWKLVKLTSCLIPGRINRNRYRSWAKRKFHI